MCSREHSHMHAATGRGHLSFCLRIHRYELDFSHPHPHLHLHQHWSLPGQHSKPHARGWVGLLPLLLLPRAISSERPRPVRSPCHTGPGVRVVLVLLPVACRRACATRAGACRAQRQTAAPTPAAAAAQEARQGMATQAPARARPRARAACRTRCCWARSSRARAACSKRCTSTRTWPRCAVWVTPWAAEP